MNVPSLLVLRQERLRLFLSSSTGMATIPKLVNNFENKIEVK